MPLGLSFGSPIMQVVVSVTSRLKVSSSRRCVPGVDIDDDIAPSDVFEGDFAPSDDFDGDADLNLSKLDGESSGEDVNRVVVVLVVCCCCGFKGDLSRLLVSIVMLHVFFSFNGLRMGTVGSPREQ